MITTILGKDLRQQTRNGTLLVFALVLPLGLALLFNTILSGTEQVGATFAVVDADGGELARVFTDEVLGPVGTAEGFQVRAVPDAAEGRRLAADGEVDATFLIPPGFSEAVTAGRPAEVEVIGSVDAPIGSAIAAEIARRYTTELAAVRQATAVAAGAGATPEQLAALARATGTAPTPVVVTDDPTRVSRELSRSTYYSAGMAVFFLLFTAGLSIRGLVVEREEGTMARLLAAPTRRGAVLVGKLLATLAIGLLAMTLLVAASTLLLGADWGPLPGVAVMVGALALAATGVAALLATFARNPEQAGNWTSVVGVVFGLFGGSFVPLSQLGDLVWLSYLTPHRWFLQGLSDLASGDLAVVVTPAAVLLGFAAGTFGLAATRLGKVIRP